MKKMQLILLLSLAVLAVSLPLPQVPNDFSAQIEINLLERNETIRRNEYRDYENNRVRHDTYRQNGITVDILDLNKNTHYTLANYTSCSVKPVNGSYRGNLHDFHISNGTSVFESNSASAVYLGKGLARGIACDVWAANVSQEWNATSIHETLLVNYTIQWFFSEDSWTIMEGSQTHAVPIQIIQVGEVTFANGTLAREFNHVYEIMFFEVGVPRPWIFDFVPRFFLCGSLDNVSMPTLPDQWEASWEYTEPDNNFTAMATEYYDYPNRFRLDFTMDNEHISEIIDLAAGVRYEIIDQINCTINEFNGGWNGGKLPNSSALFHFGAEYNEVYEGVRSVRGIPVDMWVGSDTRQTSEYTDDITIYFYFVVGTHTMRGTTYNRVPIKMDFFTTRTFTNASVPVEKITSIFELFKFAPLPQLGRDLLFQPPTGIYCVSDIQYELPSLPDDFSTGIEFTIKEKNYTGYLHEYVDYDNNRARIETHRRGSSVVTILLPALNLEYTVRNGDRCQSRFFNASNFLQGGHLQSASSFFRFGQQFDEQYQGVRTVRGIPCNYWISRAIYNESSSFLGNASYDYLIHFYFALPEWSTRSSHMHSVPVRCEIQGSYQTVNATHNFDHVYDFVNFIANDTRNHFFTPELEWDCPNVRSSFAVLRLAIPRGNFSHYLFAHRVGQSLNVLPDQVVPLEITSVDENAIDIVLAVKTLTPSEFLRVNTMLENEVQTNSFNAGYAILSAAVATGDCPNSCSSNGVCHFGACICSSGFAGEDCSHSTASVNPLPLEETRGVSPGAVVGYVFLGVGVGVLIGLGVFYIFFRRKFETKLATQNFQLKE